MALTLLVLTRYKMSKSAGCTRHSTVTYIVMFTQALADWPIRLPRNNACWMDDNFVSIHRQDYRM